MFFQQRFAQAEEEKKYTFAPTIPLRASIIIDDKDAPQAPVFDRLNSSRQYMQNILSQVRTYELNCENRTLNNAVVLIFFYRFDFDISIYYCIPIFFLISFLLLVSFIFLCFNLHHIPLF